MRNFVKMATTSILQSSDGVNGVRIEVRLSFTSWQGETRIDIRRWEENPWRKSFFPTKSGVSIPMQRWRNVIEKRGRILDMTSGDIIHLSGNLTAERYSYDGVTLRDWFVKR